MQDTLRACRLTGMACMLQGGGAGPMSSAAMSRVARVLERMANQNTFADVSMDFRVSMLFSARHKPPSLPASLWLSVQKLHLAFSLTGDLSRCCPGRLFHASRSPGLGMLVSFQKILTMYLIKQQHFHQLQHPVAL